MGIPTRAAGFRFSDEEYGMMDWLITKYWPLVRTRRQSLAVSLKAFADASSMQTTLSETVYRLQRALCAQMEKRQFRLPFPRQEMQMRPKFSFKEEAAA